MDLGRLTIAASLGCGQRRWIRSASWIRLIDGDLDASSAADINQDSSGHGYRRVLEKAEPCKLPLSNVGLNRKLGSLVCTEFLRTTGIAAENTPSADGAAAARGRALFNSNCSHCHGPNAASPETRTDLRRLRMRGRYGTQTDEVFSTTVRDGRPEKGMPLWKGVLSEDDLAAVKAFVDSVQQAK